MENKQEIEEKEALLKEYRSFEEFRMMSDEQLLEVDQFLRSYSQLVYNCFSRVEQKAKVIHVDFSKEQVKAAW